MLDTPRALVGVYGNTIGMQEETSLQLSPDKLEALGVSVYATEAMATVFRFRLASGKRDLLDSAAMEAEELLEKLEQQLSLYVEHSDTTRINRSVAGDELAVSQGMVDCLLTAFEAGARLRGKFSPFMGQAAIEAKGQRPILPHLRGTDIEEGMSREPVISLDQSSNRVRKLRTGPLLDFGGIGKGFALDCVKRHLEDWDFQTGLLDSGGSTFLAMGAPADMESWTLNIGYRQSTRAISLPEGLAIASSGELFQESHVIDPDGWKDPPIWSRAYAIADSAALADAASTAARMLGKPEILSICEESPSLSFALYSDSDTFFAGSFFEQEDRREEAP